jgi:hypothetical protein
MALADEKASFLIIVDRHGILSWSGNDDGPAGLPDVCRHGLLKRWFKRERPRLRESSGAVEDVRGASRVAVVAVFPEGERLSCSWDPSIA